MMQRSAPPSFPEAHADDDDDVTWALETAAVQWKRGAHADALEWLRRAAESAVDGGRAIRARELTQSTNAIEMALRAGWVPAVPQTPLPPHHSGRPSGLPGAGGYSLQGASVPPAPESPRPFPLRTPRPPANPFLSPPSGGPLRVPSRVPTPFGPPPARGSLDEDGTESLDSDAYREVPVDLDMDAELLVPSQPSQRRSRPAYESVEEIEAVEADEDVEEFDDADVIALSIPNPQAAAGRRAPLMSAPEVEAEEIELDDALLEDDDELEEAEIELEPDEEQPANPPASRQPLSRAPVASARSFSSTAPNGAARARTSSPARPGRSSLPAQSRTAAPLSSKPPSSGGDSRRPKAAALLRAQMRTERRLSRSSEPVSADSQRPDSTQRDSKPSPRKQERYRFRRREPEPKLDPEPPQEEPTEPGAEPASTSAPPSTMPEAVSEETTERTLDLGASGAAESSRAPAEEPAVSSAPPPSSVSSLPPDTPNATHELDSETPDTEREERRADASATSDTSAEEPSPASEDMSAEVPTSESIPAFSGQRFMESTTPAQVFVTSSVPTYATLASESADAALLAPTSAPMPVLSPPPLPVASPSDVPPSIAPPPRPTTLGGLSLANVPGLEDLPEESQADLIEKADIHRLSLNEEVAGFGMALILEGSVAVMPEIADVMAAPAQRGDLVFCTGHLEEGVALRVVALSEAAEVATWPSSAFDAAIRECPWVGDELKNVGDRLQALSGVLMGPMGDQLDDQLRALIIQRCEIRRLLPNEVIAEAGKGVPGMVIVGAGRVEILDASGQSVSEQLGPGEFLFAQQILAAAPAPATARAGKGGAIVLFAERKVAHELMVSVPPLLLIFAQ